MTVFHLVLPDEFDWPPGGDLLLQDGQADGLGLEEVEAPGGRQKKRLNCFLLIIYLGVCDSQLTWPPRQC